jgi:tRNA (mo5U34)-methyltransferase
MPFTMTPDAARVALQSCPEWFHSIELAPGVVTPGRVSADWIASEWRSLGLTDLRGCSVLDIGAYDGAFSFAAERAGATRVVALDHYVWMADMVGYMADWRASKAAGGTPLPPPHTSGHWHPNTLPGKQPFDLAHRALGSRVETVVGDFMTMDLTPLGTFDVVLFFGVLYHLRDPLGALDRLAILTAPGRRAFIATQAAEIPGAESQAHWECFPGQDLNNDPTNWWAPNATALVGCLHAVGFREVTVLDQVPRRGRRLNLQLARHYLLETLGQRLMSPPVSRYRLLVEAKR